MDIVFLKDYSVRKKGDTQLNVNYTVAQKLIREKIAKEASLSDIALATEPASPKKVVKKQVKKVTDK